MKATITVWHHCTKYLPQNLYLTFNGKEKKKKEKKIEKEPPGKWSRNNKGKKEKKKKRNEQKDVGEKKTQKK